MEATFVIDPQAEDEVILSKILKFVKSKKQPVTVRLTASQREDFDWKEWLRGMEEVRGSMEKNPIPPGINILTVLQISSTTMNFK